MLNLTMLLLSSLILSTISFQGAHSDSVTAVTFRPDGQVVATGGWDDVIRVWQTSNGKLLRTLRGHKSHITALAFNPSGKLLASSSADGTIRLWSGVGSNHIRTIKGGTSYVSGVSFTYDGKYLVSAGYDNKAKLWNPNTGALVKTLSGLRSDAYCLATSPCEPYVAAGGPDKSVRIWDTSGKLVASITDINGDVADVTFSPDGKLVGVGCLNGNVLIYEWRNQQLIVSLRNSPDPSCDTVAFSPNGHFFACGNRSGSIYVVRVNDWAPLPNIGTMADMISSLQFSPNSQMIAAGCFDGTVTLWSLEDGRATVKLTR
jgi:WD40 repeat protein